MDSSKIRADRCSVMFSSSTTLGMQAAFMAELDPNRAVPWLALAVGFSEAVLMSQRASMAYILRTQRATIENGSAPLPYTVGLSFKFTGRLLLIVPHVDPVFIDRLGQSFGHADSNPGAMLAQYVQEWLIRRMADASTPSDSVLMYSEIFETCDIGLDIIRPRP